MLRKSDNPPILPPAAASLAELKGRWWVAHTRARNEKALAWDLLRKGIGYFLPLLERVRYSGGRRRKVMLPLFTSYVFINGDDEDRYEAMTTDRISHTLETRDQEALRRELLNLERALAARADLDPFPHAAVGRRCRIKAGPFKGLEGPVVRREQRSRIVIEVTLLGQGAAMEVDADLLEPA